MNAAATAKKVPQLDWDTLYPLAEDDTRDGFQMKLGDFIHVDLTTIEAAYLEADKAGFVAGAIVRFAHDKSGHVGVVTGRNLSILSGIYTPARYPVEVMSCRGHFEYGVDNLILVEENVAEVIGMIKDADGTIVEGMLEFFMIDEFDGKMTVHAVIDGKPCDMRSFATLEMATN